jgi:predicted nucleic acid-binding protein
MKGEDMGKALRVYVDTSVFGGALDREFAAGSQAFFSNVRRGALRMTVSALVENELQRAPAAVRRLFDDLEPLVTRVDISEAAYFLQQSYLAAGIVSAQRETDALHVATATASGCEAIVSWNFKHIVNFRRISLYNEVNRMEGYGPIAIHTPMEVIFDEEDEESL